MFPIKSKGGGRDDATLVPRRITDAVPLVLAENVRLVLRRVKEPGCASLRLQRPVLVLHDDVGNLLPGALVLEHAARHVPLDDESRRGTVAQEKKRQL